MSCRCWVFLSYLLLPPTLKWVTGLNVSRLICQDISNGLERIPVPASNTIDKPPQPPTGMFQLVALINQEIFLYFINSCEGNGAIACLVGFISTLRVVLISFCIKLYYVKNA